MPTTSSTLGDTRDAFMARVREALEHDATAAPAEPPPAVDESLVRLASSAENLVDRFEAGATAVGMKVYRCEQAALSLKLGSVLDLIGVTTAAAGIGTLGRLFDLDATLAAHHVERVDWQDVPDGANPFEPLYDVGVGITDVAAALAETGTLVAHSGRGRSRGLSLVPPFHIALVRKSDILPDMIDYWDRLQGIPGPELPSSQSFITGPSKTADIEGQLITGVHGPGAVHILLITDA